MRLISLFLACLCFGSFVGCSKPEPNGSTLVDRSDGSPVEESAVNEKLSERARRDAAKLKLLIKTEIEALRKHTWAGSYYKGDGLGENVSLILSPANGYLFEWHGCMGLYDRNYGNIELQEKRLRLSFTFPNPRHGFQGIAEKFLPVSWGNRTYLIPSDDVVGFCNDVNSGYEPRSGVHGSYLLRDGDETKAVAGHPEIPSKFKPYLLDQPIETVITGIGNVTTRPSICEWNFKDTEVVIDAGTSDGILPGMELYVVAPDDVVNSLIIQSVEDSKSIGVMTQMDDDAAVIKAGWRLSTRPRWKN